MDDMKYPKIKNAVLLCLLIIGIQVIAGFVVGMVLGLLGYTTKSLFYGIGIMIVQILSFITIIYIGWKKTKISFNCVFKFNKVSIALWIYTILFSFGFIILSSEIDNVFNLILPMPVILNDSFKRIFINQNIFVAFILIGIIPAFTEEMTFRGLFITGFSKNYSIKKSIIVGALLFGLIHLNPWQFITAFIIGLFSGWLFYKTESLLLCIYIHLFNNTIYLLTTRFPHFIQIKGFNSNYKMSLPFQPWWFDLIGIVLVIIGFILLKKTIKEEADS
jgi:uncharacterized protein